MKMGVLIALAAVSLLTNANAQSIYKCVSTDGKTTYSNAPRPGAKEIKPAVSNAQRDLRKLTLREANLAYECSDALDYLLLDPATTSRAIVDQLGTFRQQFDKFCPRFGYKPFSAATRKFNGEHRDTLNNILKETQPDAPSGTRVYDNSGRNPRLFSGY